MANIEQMKSLISRKDGIARSNVFRVKLPSLPGATSEEVNLLCKDVVLHGKQVLTNERKVGMKTQKTPYGYGVSDVSMTFYVLNDYGIRKYFEVWQNLAVNQDAHEIGYLRGQEGYGKQIVIEQLKKGIGLPVYSTPLGIPKLPSEIQNRLPRFGPIDLAQGQLDLNYVTNDDVIYSCTLIDAFPTTMNDIQLNNELDGVVEVNVQLSYTNWFANGVNIPSATEKFIQTQIGTALSRIL